MSISKPKISLWMSTPEMTDPFTIAIAAIGFKYIWHFGCQSLSNKYGSGQLTLGRHCSSKCRWGSMIVINCCSIAHPQYTYMYIVVQGALTNYKQTSGFFQRRVLNTVIILYMVMWAGHLHSCKIFVRSCQASFA